MDFTLIFVKLFFYGLSLAAPLLFLVLLIVILGQIVGTRESWTKFDALYWSFTTATTVGYGDMRPTAPLSKVVSILIAFAGVIFTGIMVALALALAVQAAITAFKDVADLAEVKVHIEEIK